MTTHLALSMAFCKVETRVVLVPNIFGYALANPYCPCIKWCTSSTVASTHFSEEKNDKIILKNLVKPKSNLSKSWLAILTQSRISLYIFNQYFIPVFPYPTFAHSNVLSQLLNFPALVHLGLISALSRDWICPNFPYWVPANPFSEFPGPSSPGPPIGASVTFGGSVRDSTSSIL